MISLKNALKRALVKKLIELGEERVISLGSMARRMADLLTELTADALAKAAEGIVTELGYVTVYKNPEEKAVYITYEVFPAGGDADKWEQLMEKLKEQEPQFAELWDILKEYFQQYLYEYTFLYKGSQKVLKRLGGSYYKMGHIYLIDGFKKSWEEYPADKPDTELVKEALQNFTVRQEVIKNTLYHECVHFIDDVQDITEMFWLPTKEYAYHEDESEILAHFFSMLKELRGLEDLYNKAMKFLRERGAGDKDTKKYLKAIFKTTAYYIKLKAPRDPATGKYLSWADAVRMAYTWMGYLFGEDAKRELYRTYTSLLRRETPFPT